MTHIDPEEILRRELRAAAETIEPAADGLNQIRARLSAPRPLAVAWVMVGWTTVGQPALVRLDQVFDVVAEWLRPALHPVAERLHPLAERLQPVLGKVRALFTPRTGPSGRPSRYAWLRPALAVAGVIAVVAVGSFALAGPNAMLQQVGNVFGSQTHSSPPNGRPPGENNSGQQPIPTTGPGGRAASPSPSPSCTPSPRPTPSPTPTRTVTSPAPSPTPSTPSPSPTSPSPSPTSPSPSPTDSASGDSASADSASAQDTSLVVTVSPAHRGLVAKPHACRSSAS
jgi:hypothetical protein